MTHEQRLTAIQKVTIKAAAIQAVGTVLIVLSALGAWHKAYPKPAQSVGFYMGGLIVFALTVTLVQQLVSQTMATRALRRDSEKLILAMYQELEQSGSIGPRKAMSKTRSVLLIIVGSILGTWFFIQVLS